MPVDPVWLAGVRSAYPPDHPSRSMEPATPRPDSIPPAAPVLHDAWGRSPIPLDGSLERNEFPPFLVAVLTLVLALVLFQVVIAPIATVALLALEGVALSQLLEALPTVMEEHAQALITANTIGQFLGIALPAWLITRLHTRRPRPFLRLRAPDGVLLVVSVFGLFALMPVVQWFGVINEWLPLPDAIREFDQTQMDLVEQVLGGDLGIVFSLATLAVTPALCEELLFRGYVQRQFERSLGIVGGIVASGVVFGLYHIRLTQLLPLALLGIYLAYLAWRTGSLWIPIVVHFANNAFAVGLGAWAKRQPDLDLEAIEQLDMPWYAVALGAVFFVVCLVVLQHRARALLADKAAAPPTYADSVSTSAT